MNKNKSAGKSEKGCKEFFNRKARADYGIEDSFEVGIVLTGEEIKGIRNGRVNLSTSHAKIMHDEVFWIGGEIQVPSGDIQRTRKLLLHKEQIDKLIGKINEKGYTLIPLKLYLTRGKAKMELGLGHGLKKYNKKEKLKERDLSIEAGREMKNRSSK